MEIGIVDDHAIVIEGYRRLLVNSTSNIRFIASSITEAKQKLQKHTVDCMLVDLSLSDGSGIELVEYIATHYPRCKILIISMYAQEPYISRVLNLGVHGYLSKHLVAEELLEALLAVENDEQYLGADIHANQLPKDARSISASLTSREFEVFRLLALGNRPKEIARTLDIMPKTVHAHRANLMRKLNTKSNSDLLKLALELAIVDPSSIISP